MRSRKRFYRVTLEHQDGTTSTQIVERNTRKTAERGFQQGAEGKRVTGVKAVEYVGNERPKT